MHLHTLQLLKYPCNSSFHTQHVSAARKIISYGLLLMLERFGICLLRLCIRRDGERQAFVENVSTTAHNKKQQGGGGGGRH